MIERNDLDVYHLSCLGQLTGPVLSKVVLSCGRITQESIDPESIGSVLRDMELWAFSRPRQVATFDYGRMTLMSSSLSRLLGQSEVLPISMFYPDYYRKEDRINKRLSLLLLQ